MPALVLILHGADCLVGTENHLGGAEHLSINALLKQAVPVAVLKVDFGFSIA